MCTSLLEEKKIDKITAFLDFEYLQFLAEPLWKVCIINFSYSFDGIKLKLCTDVSSILKMCTFCFEEKKIIFDKITAFLDFEILQFLAKTLWKVCIINSFCSFKVPIGTCAKMFQTH